MPVCACMCVQACVYTCVQVTGLEMVGVDRHGCMANPTVAYSGSSTGRSQAGKKSSFHNDWLDFSPFIELSLYQFTMSCVVVGDVVLS